MYSNTVTFSDDWGPSTETGGCSAIKRCSLPSNEGYGINRPDLIERFLRVAKAMRDAFGFLPNRKDLLEDYHDFIFDRFFRGYTFYSWLIAVSVKEHMFKSFLFIGFIIFLFTRKNNKKEVLRLKQTRRRRRWIQQIKKNSLILL